MLFKPFFRKKENKFDHIISLGYNCEVMFRFVKYFGFEESSIFNWVGILGAEHLISVLKNFNEIGKNGFLDPNPLYEDKISKVRFHGKFSTTSGVKKEDIEQDKINLREKIEYLKEKFLRILRDDSRKLYIFKLMPKDVKIEILDEIYQTFLNMGAKNFKLLFIKEEKYKLYPENKNYIIRDVKYFANDNDVTNKKYFKNGFNKIFDEFYCDIKPKKDKKYKFEKG